MHRAIPVGNKLLDKMWKDKEARIHKTKLRNAKPSIDVKCPTRFSHLKKKAKKEQQLEERYTEIERENRILLEKMTNIMQGPQSSDMSN